ncbi:YesL family protein [Gracilibacillus dipsosauri]|uniref:YesL family protein n=1 Tax=Gracilibacillus dipsosauri TaxID=178340 RepID=UPI002409EC38
MKKVSLNGLYNCCEWVMKLTYLNILWFLFTLIGLVFLGFGPATLAMFSVSRKWILEKEEVPVFQVFWHNFKKNFFQANLLVYTHLILVYLLSVYYLLISGLEGVIGDLFQVITLVTTCYFILIICMSFPLFSHAKLSIFHYLKYSAMIVISHPFHMLALAFSILLICLLFLLLPGLIPFFSGSMTSLVTMYIASNIFRKLEQVEGKSA